MALHSVGDIRKCTLCNNKSGQDSNLVRESLECTSIRPGQMAQSPRNMRENALRLPEDGIRTMNATDVVRARVITTDEVVATSREPAMTKAAAARRTVASRRK